MAELLEQSRDHPALESKPTEIDLDRVSKNVDTWRSLLTHLGVPVVKYKALFEESQGNPTRACFEGLVFWRGGNEPCKPPTWSVLLEALEEAKKREYAQRLREDLIGGSRDSQNNPNPDGGPDSSGDPGSSGYNGDKSSDPDNEVLHPHPQPCLDNQYTEISEMQAGLISLPDNPQLKNGFDDIMGKLQAILSPKLDEQVIGHLRRMIKMKYTRGIHVAGYQPNVPTTAKGLFDFIAKKSTPYETLLLQPAANILCDKDLTEGVQNYESQQDIFFRETVTSCQKRTVKLQHRQDYTHMAVIVSKEQILLSTVVEMKEFFSDFLLLENTLFEGFQERKGCTVIFFSITRVAAAQLFDRVEPYMSDLKTKFGMTDLVAFEYCVCDLERSARGKCLTGFTAKCRNDLKGNIVLYTQAARDVVQHRDQGMAWFREAADDLDVAFKRISAAKIVGSGLGIAGGVLGVVGGGLLLGGITAPAGIALLGVGAALGVGGGITGVGATIGDIVENKRTFKRANDWIHQGKEHNEDLLRKYSAYHQVLSNTCLPYNESEENAVKTALTYGKERRDFEIGPACDRFQRADKEIQPIITDWKNALKLGAEATATAFVAGSRVTGAVTRGLVGGVEAGAEAGTAVARVAVQAAGGVVIGLSAVFMVVDLALISKTAYDLNKNKKGTELAKKLRQAADDMEEETESLRPLANFANDI